jgi:hypothetical protein
LEGARRIDGEAATGLFIERYILLLCINLLFSTVSAFGAACLGKDWIGMSSKL